MGAPRTQAGILHCPALLSPTFLGKGFSGGLQDNLTCLQSRAEIEGLQPAACKVLRSARPSSTLDLTPGDTELPNTGRCTEGRGAANRARTLPGLHAAFPRISGWKTKHGFRTETKSQSLFASPCRRPPVPARLAAAGLPGSTRSSSRRRRLFHLPAGAHFGSSHETPSMLFRLRERPGGGDPAATRQHSRPSGVPPPPPASPCPAQAALRRAALPPRRRRAEPGGPSTSPPRGGERRGKRGSRAACLPSASLEPARFPAEEQPAAALRPAVPHRILGGDCCSSFSHRLLARRHAAPNGRAASGRPEAVSRGRGAGSRYPKEQRARLGPPRPSGEEEEKKEKEAGGISAPTASWPRRHSRAAPVAQRRTPHASHWHRPGRQRPAPREHTCGEKNAARGSRWL